MGKKNRRRCVPQGYKKTQDRIGQGKEIILHWMSHGKSFAFGCAKADISYTQARKWRADDENFHIACEEAFEVGTQGLEDIADSRAKRRSDILLMFLLKGRDPKYRDKGVIIQVPAPTVNVRKF